jgi:prepilin-type N-terminal cleavage/methylation domain-containing protein
MNRNPGKKGFTLVELLVALAIIAIIVTMVYGSYFATSKSAQVCSAGIVVLQQGRKVLEQMAQQIRCSYADNSLAAADKSAVVSRKEKVVSEDAINYFSGGPDGEILRMVTTHGIFVGPQEDGLFDVIYKFDRSTATLFLSQTRLWRVGKVQDIAERRNWRPLAENVESVELAFFDGQKWLPMWDFEQERNLPSAVKISITCKDENDRRYCYDTVANICCRNGQGGNSPPGTLVTIDKQ